MAQFDVYLLASGDLVLDCQADTVDSMCTRLVVPLVEPDEVPSAIRALHPVFEINGAKRLMATHFAGAIERSEFVEVVTSVEHERYTIIKALDFLITGV